MDEKFIKYKYGFGLVGRITYFLAESNPIFVMIGIMLALGLVFLAISGRRRPLVFMLLVALVFTGSIWQSLDAYAGLLRMFLLGLLSLGIIKLRGSPGVPALLYASYILVGLPMTVFAPDILWTLQYAGILVICYLACISLGRELDSPASVARYCMLFLLAAILWSVMGGASLSTLVKQGTGGERWSAATETAGLFTQIGGTLLPFTAWGAMRPWARKWRWGCALLGLFMLFVMVMAAQRTGTIAGVLGSLPFLLRLRMKWIVGAAVTLTMLAVVMVTLAITMNQKQSEYILHRYTDDGLSNRDKIWANGLAVILENPVLGEGFGSNKRSLREEIGKHIHSMYLGVWFDTGFFGMVLITLSLAAAAWQSLRIVWSCRDPEINELGRLMLGMFLNLGAAGLVEASVSSASDIATVTYLICLVMSQRLMLAARDPYRALAAAGRGAQRRVVAVAAPQVPNPYHPAWLAGHRYGPQS